MAVRVMAAENLDIVGTRVFANAVAMATNDTSASLQICNFPDKNVQVGGTFGGGTATVQGTNDPAEAAWDTLHDPAGTALTFTAAGLKQVLENPLRIRIAVTGGAGVALTARICASTQARR